MIHFDSQTRQCVFFVGMLLTAALTDCSKPCRAADDTAVLRLDNQVAWCIVPFDIKKRGPAERAIMLNELGIKRCAYDWREEHVPTFEQEILEYKKHGIEFFAFWGVHEDAFNLFARYGLHPQIWQMMGAPAGETEAAKVESAAQQMISLAIRTKAMGCKLGLYNHGGWAGEPQNMVAVCKRLHELGHDHVGIVYNFHHGHGHINDWAESFTLMKPFLHCLNLNGMNALEQPKILGVGKGAHELDMIRTVVKSGYDGPIGIIGHREQMDARDALVENRDGLEWVRKEIEKPGSGGPKPVTEPVTENQNKSKNKSPGENIGHLYPGVDAYRKPSITIEVRATLRSRDQYNILIASDVKQSADHWELFSVIGSGHLTAYLPGAQPDHVHSEAMICDGQPHTLSMIYESDQVQLYVDGKRVADQTIRSRNGVTSVPREFSIAVGQLVEGAASCDGKIDWVRISKGVRMISAEPLVSVSEDESTIGFWTYEDAKQSPDHVHQGAAPIDSEPLYDAELVASLITDANRHGDATRGASVFADAKLACISCHKVGQHGGAVGPELTAVAKDRSQIQIIESVLWPKRDVKPEFATWTILTSAGKVVTGYKHGADEESVTLRDPASGKLISIAKDDIEDELAGSTVMPSGLMASLSKQSQLDLIRFLGELGRNGQPLSEDMQQAIAHSSSHGPADFPVTKEPLLPSSWPNSGHRVNRDRVYDFYTKQAEYFRPQPHMPILLSPFAGLDGGQQGHWGNQNDAVWNDGRWNDTKLGTVQAGIFQADGITVARGVCVRLGERGELSACFNPDTLTFDAVWSGGFVTFEPFRHGFLGGLKIDGTLMTSVPEQQAPAGPFRYHGFYRYDNRIVFSYRIGDVEYLDSPWVNDGKFIHDVAPADEHPLRQIIAGGPSQWPQVLETKLIPGAGRPYAVDTIELPYDNPWNALMFCGGHDFLPDGSALVCTMQGDVWRVTGLESGTSKQGTVYWKRFASGLHHALGLVVDGEKIYVQCRDQLTRLTDLNGDGEADFYECFCNAFVTSPAGHDFICGLQRDQHGNFYTASGNQGLLRISSDGQSATRIATGFRNPDGLGMLPDGTVTVPVSEGDWTPASAINAVRNADQASSTEPLHFGHGGPRNGKPPELPLVYLPRGLDNSSGEQVHVPSKAFGPLTDQLIHLSFGSGSWFVLLRDEVAGQLQGAIVPMAGDFLSGVHRGRFSPVDGQLYVTGMAGWGSYTPDDGCFQRVRYTGDLVQVPTGFHTHENGIRITFAQSVDASIATDVKQQFAQAWNYRYSGAYGSPESSTTHPGIAGHDPWLIKSSHVLADRCSLFLEVPDLQPVSQLHLRLHVNENDSLSCSPTGSGHDLFVTVHKLDEPFTKFPGYEPSKKTIAAHPLLTDLALNAVRVPNPWRNKLQLARAIEIETGKNLSYVTTEFAVKADEPLAITLSNPDVVPHNWVLVQPGSLQRVGELGNRLIADPEAYARHYIPESEEILAYTDIVAPSEKQTIYFNAPTTAGRYPFLCTFPGHWMVMNGVMVVER